MSSISNSAAVCPRHRHLSTHANACSTRHLAHLPSSLRCALVQRSPMPDIIAGLTARSDCALTGTKKGSPRISQSTLKSFGRIRRAGMRPNATQYSKPQSRRIPVTQQSELSRTSAKIQGAMNSLTTHYKLYPWSCSRYTLKPKARLQRPPTLNCTHTHPRIPPRHAGERLNPLVA